MKKLTLTALAVFIFAGVQSQELVSKKGETYLPEAGDWALGIDVSPFFQWVGNSANGTNNNQSPTFNYAYPFEVYGKWYKTESFAWRGRLRFLGLNNSTAVGYVPDEDINNTDPFAQVEDKMSMSRMNTTLAFGLEWRKGKTRLQGFYGAEAVLKFSSGSDKYTYGNSLDVNNVAPTSHEFGYGNTTPSAGYRLTEVKYGTGFGFGVRGFIGVEYFLFPKISLGGEFGYNLGFTSNAAPEETSEYWDGVNGSNKSATVSGAQANKSSFIMDNDNVGGSIRLMFHF